MSGLVFHGCAIPLPFPKRPGLKHQGPKPSRLFSHCRADTMLRWILWVGGAEAVADFCLERIDLAQTITERRRFCLILSYAQGRMALDVQGFSEQLRELTYKVTTQAENAADNRQRAENKASWEAKKAAIIRADEERRQQRIVRVPASPPKPTRQQQRAAAERIIRELQLKHRTLAEIA